jgi:two-component system sensor histidine kinase HydH
MAKPKKFPKNTDEFGRYKALAHMLGGFVHQLRTPLHIIQSSVEGLPGAQAELIARSAARMEASVNALLKFIRGDKPTLEPGSLNTVVEQLGDFLKLECQKRSISVEKQLKSQRPVNLDAYSLQEALINVIMNALQAMPKGGILSITTQDLPSQNKVQLEIRDSGAGMDKKTLAKIAKPFQTTKKEGMGLGIYFTRKVLELHRARIAFASASGRGTTVTMLFPAA